MCNRIMTSLGVVAICLSATVPARALPVLTDLPPVPAGDSVIFDNTNAGAVEKGTPPYNATYFTITVETVINYLQIYANSDPNPANTVSIVGIGTYDAQQTHFPGTNYIYWTALPDITLHPGTYQITTANIDWWSWDPSSHNEGFAYVAGVPVPEPDTLAALAAGLVCLGILRQTRRKPDAHGAAGMSST